MGALGFAVFFGEPNLIITKQFTVKKSRILKNSFRALYPD